MWARSLFVFVPGVFFPWSGFRAESGVFFVGGEETRCEGRVLARCAGSEARRGGHQSQSQTPESEERGHLKETARGESRLPSCAECGVFGEPGSALVPRQRDVEEREPLGDGARRRAERGSCSLYPHRHRPRCGLSRCGMVTALGRAGCLLPPSLDALSLPLAGFLYLYSRATGDGRRTTGFRPAGARVSLRNATQRNAPRRGG